MDKKQLLISLLLFGLPLFFWPGIVNPFEPPKVMLAEALIAFLCLVFLFEKGKQPFRRLPLGAIVCFGLIGAVSVIDVLLFPTSTSLFGNPIRLQGTVVLWYLLLFGLVASQFEYQWHPRLILITVLLVGVTTSILPTDTNRHWYGLAGDSHALAACALFLLPLIVTLLKGWQRLVGLTLLVILLIAARSSGGFIGLFLEGLFFFLIRYFRLPGAFAVGICVVILAVGVVFPFYQRSIAPIAPSRASVVWRESRADIWQTAFFAGLFHPIAGNGFGNTEHAIKTAAFLTDQKYFHPLLGNTVRFQYVDSSHNLFLDWWVQGGIIGLVSLVGLIILAIQTCLKHADSLRIALFIGIITVLFFNPPSVVTLVYFWWLVGSSLGMNDHARAGVVVGRPQRP